MMRLRNVVVPSPSIDSRVGEHTTIKFHCNDEMIVVVEEEEECAGLEICLKQRPPNRSTKLERNSSALPPASASRAQPSCFKFHYDDEMVIVAIEEEEDSGDGLELCLKQPPSTRSTALQRNSSTLQPASISRAQPSCLTQERARDDEKATLPSLAPGSRPVSNNAALVVESASASKETICPTQSNTMKEEQNSSPKPTTGSAMVPQQDGIGLAVPSNEPTTCVAQPSTKEGQLSCGQHNSVVKLSPISKLNVFAEDSNDGMELCLNHPSSRLSMELQNIKSALPPASASKEQRQSCPSTTTGSVAATRKAAMKSASASNKPQSKKSVLDSKRAHEHQNVDLNVIELNPCHLVSTMPSKCGREKTAKRSSEVVAGKKRPGKRSIYSRGYNHTAGLNENTTTNIDANQSVASPSTASCQNQQAVSSASTRPKSNVTAPSIIAKPTENNGQKNINLNVIELNPCHLVSTGPTKCGREKMVRTPPETIADKKKQGKWSWSSRGNNRSDGRNEDTSATLENIVAEASSASKTRNNKTDDVNKTSRRLNRAIEARAETAATRVSWQKPRRNRASRKLKHSHVSATELTTPADSFEMRDDYESARAGSAATDTAMLLELLSKDVSLLKEFMFAKFHRSYEESFSESDSSQSSEDSIERDETMSEDDQDNYLLAGFLKLLVGNDDESNKSQPSMKKLYSV